MAKPERICRECFRPMTEQEDGDLCEYCLDDRADLPEQDPSGPGGYRPDLWELFGLDS